MYLNFIERQDAKYITKMGKECTTYGYGYIFWKEHLLERVQRLFVYKGLPDGLPQKEIELPLYLKGFVGICDYKNELTAFNGTFHGVTKYIDEFTHFNCYCPIDTFTKKINDDIIVIENTSLRNPLLPLIHHYAVMLAHTDVTLVNSLINVRDNGGVPVAPNEKTKASIEQYHNKLYNGQYGIVTDLGLQGVDYVGTTRGGSQSIKEIYEVREKLIKSFYQAIGIKGSFEKNNNAVSDEVTSDTSLLQINIHDMLECRKTGIEKVNNMFGTSIEVNLAPEILDLYKCNSDSECIESEVKDNVEC